MRRNLVETVTVRRLSLFIMKHFAKIRWNALNRITINFLVRLLIIFV